MNTHNAPPVVYPLGRSPLQGWFLLALWSCGLLVTGLWACFAQQSGWQILMALACVITAGCLVFRGWRNSPAGELAWDGELWRWESTGYQSGVADQQLFVIADFQGLLLLRIENQAHASLWLLADKSSFPERWMDLRRAVYSPARSMTLPHNFPTDGSHDPVAILNAAIDRNPAPQTP